MDKSLKMKKILFAGLICFAAFIVSFSSPDSWYKYTTTQGHASISFPGKPDESIDTSRADNGTPFKIHFSTYSPTDDIVYMMGWIDMNGFYPQDRSMQKILEDSRDGATGSLGATEVKTINTNLVNEPYIDFTFAGADFVGKERIYVIDKFQYSVITLFSKTKTIPADADKFITSYKHIK